MNLLESKKFENKLLLKNNSRQNCQIVFLQILILAIKFSAGKAWNPSKTSYAKNSDEIPWLANKYKLDFLTSYHDALTWNL